MSVNSADTKAVDKRRILQALRDRLAADLAGLTRSQQASQAGATHAEARPENDKDTRALEATYLARGLAGRVVALEAALVAVDALKMRDFGLDDPIALCALVTLESASGCAHYFVVPSGGGIHLQVDGLEVLTVTPKAPVGPALIGKHCDDDVDVQTPQGKREYTVLTVR